MISAVILAKNEENNIVNCIESITFCDEIIVIDDESTDRTVELAKRNDAKVISHALKENFAEQRNFAISQTKNEWVLFIDADEVVSEDLKNEILLSIQEKSVNGYKLRREDIMWGKKLQFGDTGQKELVRLGRKGKRKWRGVVHETWEIEGKVGSLKSPLFHYPHQNISSFLQEINFYSTLRARELNNRKKKSNWLVIISYPIAKFLTLYFIKLGILDGMHGLVHAIMMSLYSYLVRSKLYLLQNK